METTDAYTPKQVIEWLAKRQQVPFTKLAAATLELKASDPKRYRALMNGARVAMLKANYTPPKKRAGRSASPSAAPHYTPPTFYPFVVGPHPDDPDGPPRIFCKTVKRNRFSAQIEEEVPGAVSMVEMICDEAGTWQMIPEHRIALHDWKNAHTCEGLRSDLQRIAYAVAGAEGNVVCDTIEEAIEARRTWQDN